MSDSSSVVVKPYKHYRAIVMKWHKNGEKADIKQAFDDIMSHLDTAREPIYVVVDLRENKFIPMTDTYRGAMAGPHRHEKLAAWLCIGENRFARYIADVLNVFTEESKIQWFGDESQVDTFLEQHQA